MANRANCFQWFKDTNLRANHNANHNIKTINFVLPLIVFNGSKILI